MGGDFGERNFVAGLRRDRAEWFDVIQLVRTNLSWGRPPARLLRGSELPL